MRVAMTMIVRNEADILEANVRYHRLQGVSQFLIIDHASIDDTPGILADLTQDGDVLVLREESDEGKWFPQGPWFTRLARMAATDFGADWVINCDADEFWWPIGTRLPDMFASIPRQFGLVSAPVNDFVGVHTVGKSFAETMIVRERRSRHTPKMAHRAQPDVSVTTGSHSVGGAALIPMPAWPARIFHFPIRSISQLARRAEARARHGKQTYREEYEALLEGRLAELYAARAYDEQQLAVGIAAGHLVVDTRVRDLLHAASRVEADPDAELADVYDDMIHALERDRRRTSEKRDRRLDRALARIEKLEARSAKLQQRHDKLASRLEPRSSATVSRPARGWFDKIVRKLAEPTE